MSIVSKLNHFVHPVQGEVWCLHRVVGERSNYPSNRELEITPDYLEDLILKYKREGYSFVDLETIVQNSQRKRDDCVFANRSGWRNNRRRLFEERTFKRDVRRCRRQKRRR